MITLDAGNVLLKPSHRRQLMAWLRRSLRIGQRLGRFALNITMHRSGRQYEVRASVKDSAGTFTCRSRRTDWRDAAPRVGPGPGPHPPPSSIPRPRDLSREVAEVGVLRKKG